MESELRARLKELEVDPHGWRWDEDDEDECCFLLLHDPCTSISEQFNQIGFLKTKEGKWRIEYVTKVPPFGRGMQDADPYDTLQEAKRSVDILLGFDTGPIPPYKVDCN